MRPLGWVVVLALLAPTPALGASPVAELKRARDRFEYGDYKDAARVAARLIDDKVLSGESQLIEAYRILGLSYFYLDRPKDARSALVLLLSVDPDFTLDPFFHPPKLVEFFDQVKAENEELLAPIREQMRRLAQERRRQEEIRREFLDEERRRREKADRLASENATKPTIVIERVVSNHDYAVNWLPLGAGQFQNGDDFKGGLLAGAQAVTGAASIIGFVTVAALDSVCVDRESPVFLPLQPVTIEQVCGVQDGSANLARQMNTVKWVAGAAFWSLVIYGIIDAHLYFEPLVVISETLKEIPREAEAGVGESEPIAPPEEPSARLRLSPWFGPGSAGAFLTLEF